jgi:hypothetical protein
VPGEYGFGLQAGIPGKIYSRWHTIGSWPIPVNRLFNTNEEYPQTLLKAEVRQKTAQKAFTKDVSQFRRTILLWKTTYDLINSYSCHKNPQKNVLLENL